jgi:hypothetical protein
LEEADDVDLDGNEEPSPFSDGLNGGCWVVPARAKLPGSA